MPKMIPCDQILADLANNCSRQDLTPEDCEDIAASIEVNGLLQSVVVRPMPHPEGGKRSHDYQLVVGYRRFTAVSVNLGRAEIKCEVREFTDAEAKVANVIENLQRKDITFWEECCALRIAFPEKTTIREIMVALSKSDTYCRNRWMFWTLPKSVRDKVEVGVFGPADVGIILQQKPEDQVRAATKLKDGKAAGSTLKDLQRSLTNRKAPRSKKEVMKMMTICMERGETIAVHALRYSCGEISDTLFLELLDNPTKV